MITTDKILIEKLISDTEELILHERTQVAKVLERGRRYLLGSGGYSFDRKPVVSNTDCQEIQKSISATSDYLDRLVDLYVLEKHKKEIKVYFPMFDKVISFEKDLKEMGFDGQDSEDRLIQKFFLDLQPFSGNSWLMDFKDLARRKKHHINSFVIEKEESRVLNVSGSSFGGSGVINGGVFLGPAGCTIVDEYTQENLKQTTCGNVLSEITFEYRYYWKNKGKKIDLEELFNNASDIAMKFANQIRGCLG